MSTVLTDFALSMIVSVPTSRRPIEFGSTLYFFIKDETTGEEYVRNGVDRSGQEGRLFRSAGAAGEMKERFAGSVVEKESQRRMDSETNRPVRSRGTNDGRAHQTLIRDIQARWLDVRTIQRKRVDVLPVVSEDHVFLAKANGVFSSRDSIKLL